MEISYLGHSCFRIRGKDASVLTDPFSPKFGLNMGRVNANIVTVSQRSGGDSEHHRHTSAVGGEPRLIDGPGEYEIAGVLVNGVGTFVQTSGSEQPQARDLNTVYVIDVDEMRVCHLGDLARKLTPEQVETLGAINVLMVPVGGGSTIGPNQAAEVVSQLEPNMVVPMHYQIAKTQAESLEPVDRFLREMGAKSIEPVPKISLNARSSLSSDIQVVVMSHRA